MDWNWAFFAAFFAVRTSSLGFWLFYSLNRSLEISLTQHQVPSSKEKRCILHDCFKGFVLTLCENKTKVSLFQFSCCWEYEESKYTFSQVPCPPTWVQMNLQGSMICKKCPILLFVRREKSSFLKIESWMFNRSLNLGKGGKVFFLHLFQSQFLLWLNAR